MPNIRRAGFFAHYGRILQRRSIKLPLGATNRANGMLARGASAGCLMYGRFIVHLLAETDGGRQHGSLKSDMNRMLKVDKSLLSDEVNPRAMGPLESGPRNFYMRVIRHQLPIMIVFMVLSMALTFLYLFTTVPTFVATASMVIDARKLQTLNPQNAASGAVNVDTSMVQTEM